jgi:two-component system sensor histidine kinase KdpD
MFYPPWSFKNTNAWLYQRQMWMYLAAVIMPFIATLMSYGVEVVLPYSNIALVYLTGVLLVAVRTDIKPALLCTAVSFLCYDFFFGEPRLTFARVHREDFLTVGFFVVMAAVIGHLTGRLRERILELKSREHIIRVQFELSKRLTATIDQKDVVRVLCNALNDLVCEKSFAVKLDHNDHVQFIVDPEHWTPAEEWAMRFAARTFAPAGKFTAHQPDAAHYFIPLSDGRRVAAVIGMIFRGGATSIQEKITVVGLLLQQASLALGRTQLVSDLQRERLEKEQERLRSALLSSVSHDLRTPLASMIGATTSLLDLDEALDSSQKHELLEAVLEEAQRLDRYIQNLLDMTRLGGGELELERDWIGFEDLLSMVLKRIRPLLRRHTIQTEMANNLPLLYVHPALSEQAIFNVMENAVKFSPDASPITVSVRCEGQGVTIDIADCGPGIPLEERKRIFDMFHTVRRGDRHAAGTGLGLTIAKAAVTAHGGTIEVLDGPDGVGTVIRITLPPGDQSKQMGKMDGAHTGH